MAETEVDTEKDASDTTITNESKPDTPPENAQDASLLSQSDIDPVYEAKARVLNNAIQEIGMGKYQWQLFIVVGFGWANDNLWPIVTSLIFTPIANEFKPAYAPLLSLAQNVGLLAGAMFWGFECDIFGRRWAFNLTLCVTGVFGMIAAGSPSFSVIGMFAALWSFGVGGNLPVDSAVFLEFLPGSHQFLLTVLSVQWAITQVVATLIAWPLLGKWSCEQGAKCTKEKNQGWRYFVLVAGGLSVAAFIVRLAFFTIYESPKYLMGKGRDRDAVRVVREVARRNGKTSSLSLRDLKACGTLANTGHAGAARRRLATVDFEHIRALFKTPRLAFSTALIMSVWAFIELGYPLHNAFIPYLQALKGAETGVGSADTTYRNSLIIATLGVPGALLAGAMVEVPKFGRRGALAGSTMLTGAFLYASTTAVSTKALLGWQCVFNLSSNIMFAVLYGFTPEIFSTKDRGTGNALTATANRIFGIMAPIIAMFADLRTSVPVYISGALFVAAGVLVVFLPFESRGKASL